ncbi:DUF2188 domain-containing protein [[Acholeplasma] multilocale]|uniref:DUF2188 domain-containing protein n=1 Tax=[Acholeplasma] multilocale TaxID=264638 RepID=UPI00047C4B0F|nr:DUF2188 domain-containing protein [[Acholeplasma] multilocale]
MRWMVEKDKNGFVHVRPDSNGNFKTRDEAIEMARKLAKGNKTILRIHNQGSGYDVVDYTSILTSNELYSKTLSEVKLARAELTVATMEYKKRKEEKKSSNEADMPIARRKLQLSKDRLKKAKLNLKLAIKRNKPAKVSVHE